MHVADDQLALDALLVEQRERADASVSAAAAWPKLCATLIRQCQSAFEYGWALIWVSSTAAST